MTIAVAVYPREGTTYPDAAGVPITSAGAIVDTSKYIRDAIRAGFLLTWDPLGIYQPDDRTGIPSGGGSGGGLSFESVSDMASYIGTFDGEVATVRGYYADGDGGGGTFYWDQGASDTSDDGLIFGAAAAGRWKRLYNGPVHTRWFGAKGDGTTDDTVRLQAWIDSVTWGKVGYSDPGHYKITTPLTITKHQTTFEGGTQSVVAIDSSLAFILDWHGDASWFSGQDWALYVTGFSIMIRGWNIIASTNLWGAFHAGQIDGAAAINTRCQFVDCTAVAGEQATDAKINYGFGVGAQWRSEGRGNQDYNYYENCMARNCYEWGWIIHGSPNCLATTLRRCVVTNVLGFPGRKKYIEEGLSDGLLYTFGGGVLAYGCGSVDIDGIAFGNTETGFVRVEPTTEGTTFDSNDRIISVDCELTKKLIYVKTDANSGTLTVENGRLAFPSQLRSLGPFEFDAVDVKHVDVSGPVCRIAGLSYAVSGRTDGTVDLGSGSGILENCTLPSVLPVLGGSATITNCRGQDGSSGNPQPIKNGTFTWLDDGTVVPEPASVAQKYIAVLGSKIWDMWTADFGVEVNTSNEVLGWTSAILGIRAAPATSANRPTFATDGTNFRGKPVVHTASSTSKGLVGTAAATIAPLGGNTGSHTWSISVYRLKTVPGVGADASFCVVGTGTVLSNDIHLLEFDRISNVNTLKFKINNGIPSVTDGSTIDTNQHSYLCGTDGVNISVQRDSNSPTTSATALSTNTGTRSVGIGRRANTAINYADCAHALHLFCHSPPSAGELTRLLQVVASDWSVV